MNDEVLSVSRWASGFVVRVIGRGTMQEATRFRETVALCLKQSPSSRVVVDLSDCFYIDSTFMGAMIWLHKHAGESHPDRLQFCADQSKCRQLFAHGLLDRVLNIIATCPPVSGEPVDLSQVESETNQRNFRLVR